MNGRNSLSCTIFLFTLKPLVGGSVIKLLLSFRQYFLFVVADKKHTTYKKFESGPTTKKLYILDLFAYAYLSALKFSLLR